MGVPDDEREVEFDDDVPLLPEQTADNADADWGHQSGRNLNDFRLWEDRPPHWG